MRCDLVRTSALALAFVGSVGLAAVQQPPPNAGPPADVVFVNGAWAVPDAPANTDTVPAKFSAKNGPTTSSSLLPAVSERRFSILKRSVARGLGQPVTRAAIRPAGFYVRFVFQS